MSNMQPGDVHDASQVSAQSQTEIRARRLLMGKPRVMLDELDDISGHITEHSELLLSLSLVCCCFLKINKR